MHPPARRPDCTLEFIGTATTVLRLGPFTLLTDPNFLHRGQWAYLGKGLASRRRTEPSCSPEDLPELDAVLLSHMHGDHWDRVARRGLDRGLPVLTTPAAARALHRQGFRAAVGLPTWTSQELERSGHTLRITALPGRHARGALRHVLPPVMGSYLEYVPPAGEPFRLYITGDTLFVDEVRAIRDREPVPHAAVLHLGGTTLLGRFVVTMDGAEGAELVRFLQPAVAVPVHNDDYGVFRSPRSDFVAAAERLGIGDVVRTVERGERVSLRPDEDQPPRSSPSR